MKIEDLRLDFRSLTYSHVVLTCGSDTHDFFVGGVPCKYDIEETDGFQEFVADREESAEIEVHVEMFNVGRGESEYPDDDEMISIILNWQAIEEKYGIDALQDDRFTHLYEPEVEW